MAHQSGRIDYDHLIEDEVWELSDDNTRPAGCAVCWAGCLPKERRGAYPSEWRWMYDAHVLVDNTLLCDDGEDAQTYLSSLPPPPLRIGSEEARYTSQVSTERHNNDRSISRLPALLWFKNFFLLSNDALPPGPENGMSSEEIEEPAVAAYSTDGSLQPLFYLPVHDTCLSILDRFLAGSQHRSTLAHFYDSVLLSYQRWTPDSDNSIFNRAFNDLFYDDQLKDRVGSRSAVPFSFDVLFRREIDWHKIQYFADPLDVGPYTQALLANARHRSDHNWTTGITRTQFDQLLSVLPQELFDQIIEELCPLTLTTTCTRIVSSDFWRGLLITPGMLPFLWDIDADVVRRASDQIDWELLVRTLAQPDPFNRLADVPLGLHNRHSIWKDLEARASASLPAVSRSSGEDQTAPSSLTAECMRPAKHGEGQYTSVEIEWTRRTEEQIMLYTSVRDYRSGHWTLKWRRLPAGG